MSLVCGSCTEREKASVERGRPGLRAGPQEGACQRQTPEALSTGCGACWRTGSY